MNKWLFWAVPVAVTVLYETDILPAGVLTDDAQGAYSLQTVTILLTIVLIPLALGMGNVAGKLPSVARKAMLPLAATVGMVAYYCTMNTAGLLCACMALIAALAKKGE